MAKKAVRPIRIEGNVAYIALSKGYEAIIDADDVHLVEGYNWSASVMLRRDGSIRTVYALRGDPNNGKRKTLLMHRAILGARDGFEGDHIDGNGLDNRRSNLRTATHAQNGRNRRTNVTSLTGVKGVLWVSGRKKWLAKISCDGERLHLGMFDSLQEAQAAYVDASKMLHGEFSRVS